MPHTKTEILEGVGIVSATTLLSSSLLNSLGFLKQTSPWKQTGQIAFGFTTVLTLEEMIRSNRSTNGDKSTASKIFETIIDILSYLGQHYGEGVPLGIMLVVSNLLGYGMRTLVEDCDELVPSVAIGALTASSIVGLMEVLKRVDSYLDKPVSDKEKTSSSFMKNN